MASNTRTNITVDAELLSQARDLGGNVSAVLETRLREIVAALRRERWLAENREAIAGANDYLDRHGLWSDGLRQF